MNNNRRRSTRFPLELPALIQWDEGSDTRTIETLTKDISSSGLYLLLDKQCRPSSCIEFKVQLPGSPGVSSGAMLLGRGRLIRQEQFGDHRIGIAAVIERCELRPVKLPSSEAPHRLKPKAVAR